MRYRKDMDRGVRSFPAHVLMCVAVGPKCMTGRTSPTGL